MAANIFNETDYVDIKTRIHQLNIQSQRQWGTMSLPQMLEHCSVQLKKALGIIPEGAYEGPSMYRTAFGHWLLFYAMPWPKSAATPSQMNMLSNGATVADVQDSKRALLGLLEKVQSQYQFNTHPFFGKMDKKDWGRLIWKHLDHHLKQFGN
jgi:hypothetical protein